MENLKVKQWQIIEIDEKSIGLNYEGVDTKGRRPFLIIKTNLSQGSFLAVPLTSIKNSDGIEKDKHANWVTYKYKSDSYIKIDQIRSFNIYEQKNYIYAKNHFIQEYLAKKIMKILKELF